MRRLSWIFHFHTYIKAKSIEHFLRKCSSLMISKFDSGNSLLCHTRLYLNQCSLRFMTPYGIIRPQWVNHFRLFALTIGDSYIYTTGVSFSIGETAPHHVLYDCISGECAVPGLNATFCFLWFTNCVLLFDKSPILWCLWPLLFVLNNTLILSIRCSSIPHLPGCFCPWTFYENIGFNTVLTDPFMSHVATQLGYSAGEFQALQLIILATFGVVD